MKYPTIQSWALTQMNRSLGVTLLLGVLALLQSGFCRAATFEECVYPSPIFDGQTHFSDAVVVGDPGSKALMHPFHPSLCQSLDDRSCSASAYVVPGDHVQAARRCGAWVYAKFLGKRHTTLGWIDAERLSDSPADSVTSQTPVDVTKAPNCTHDTLWFAYEGRFSASSGELIAVHARNPMLCTEPAAGFCGVITSIKPGPTTYYSDQCGDWVYASSMGMGSEGGATGWVDARNVVPLVPSTQPPNRTARQWQQDALYKAVVADDSDEIRQLVASGRDLNKPIDMGFPESVGQFTFLILSTAIEQRNVHMVRLLLSLGANANGGCMFGAVANNLGGAPVYITTAPHHLTDITNNLEIAKVLIESGADVNCGKGIPIRWAAGEGGPVDDALLKLLIAAHADVNVGEGAPLAAAISRNNVEGVELLLAAGAKPHLGIKEPLLLALDWYRADPAMILTLLNAGADANYREPDYTWISPRTGEEFQAQTVLTIAAEKGYLEVVKILFDHGADPLKPRQDGLLPAAVAEKAGHRDVAALIGKYAGRHTNDR